MVLVSGFAIVETTWQSVYILSSFSSLLSLSSLFTPLFSADSRLPFPVIAVAAVLNYP
jgi:hypothetical protein